MTTTAETSPLRGIRSSPFALWTAFVLVHLWLGMLNLYADGYPLGDVTIVYKFWTDQAIIAHYWVGIDAPWVYPIVAIVPMLLARVFGSALYASTWLSLMMLMNAVAFGFLTGWRRRSSNPAVAWWWVAFLFLLGPIALARIDSLTVPLAIIGVLFVSTRPALAAVILTVATWIKVWPGAIIVALVIAAKSRWRVLAAAVTTSLIIIAIALVLGSGLNVFSFVTEQTSRGLQIEAPVSSIWLWEAFSGRPGSRIYYDTTILTYQVLGDGAGLVGSLMTPLLVLVALAIALLAILGVRNRAPVTDVLPALVLALITAFIAFNKVGSPQFVSWLAVPVILGLATAATGHGRSFRVPAALVAVLALLTQSFYPYLYGRLLSLDPFMLVLLTARNLLLFVLLGWAVFALWRSVRPGARHEDLIDESRWLPSVWTFGATVDRLAHDHPAPTEEENHMLVAFSIAPSGGSTEGDSVHDAVAAAVRIVRESGLPNHTSSMFTEIEGEWDEVFDVIRRATDAVAAFGTRVSLVLKADIRPGHTGEITGKVERLEQAILDAE